MSFQTGTIPSRRGRGAALFREAWREGAGVRKRAVASLTRPRWRRSAGRRRSAPPLLATRGRSLQDCTMTQGATSFRQHPTQ